MPFRPLAALPGLFVVPRVTGCQRKRNDLLPALGCADFRVFPQIADENYLVYRPGHLLSPHKNALAPVPLNYADIVRVCVGALFQKLWGAGLRAKLRPLGRFQVAGIGQLEAVGRFDSAHACRPALWRVSEIWASSAIISRKDASGRERRRCSSLSILASDHASFGHEGSSRSHSVVAESMRAQSGPCLRNRNETCCAMPISSRFRTRAISALDAPAAFISHKITRSSSRHLMYTLLFGFGALYVSKNARSFFSKRLGTAFQFVIALGVIPKCAAALTGQPRMERIFISSSSLMPRAPGWECASVIR
ncbi:single-stranded DNA-binding protein [Acetobacter orientalis]|uniref:Single-stranded DNA-binding protein n=1 Tax=Acetobacter orientalis TaxID=146474 RepID=A0A2Z5ZMG2_9PROT|nr:single-stranded DNA-binding protein [Acetobacter orientalis]